MIGSLMYLTASQPDIQLSACLCVRYQANPKESYLTVVKEIFKYLKGKPTLGPWYPKCSRFDLKGYSESDYAGCNIDRKSTSGTKIDIEDIIFNDLVSRLTEKPRRRVILGMLNYHWNSYEVPPIELIEYILSVGPKASRVPPKETKGKNQAKTKQSTLKKSKLILTKKKGSSRGTDKSQSVSTDQLTDAKDSDGNTQLVDMGLPAINPNEGIRTSQPLPEGINPDPKDSKGNKQPADIGLPSTHKDGIHIS
ncbi:hypothetical protein Tco_0432390 [Tanacetum coccineum]